MEHHHEWGWMIAVDLFLGGMGAAALVLGATAHLSRRSNYRAVARAGALLGPILVGLGTLLVVADLGKPLNSWRLLAHFNPVSPMSIGAWLVNAFLIVSLPLAVLLLPPSWLRGLAARLSAGRLREALTGLASWNEPTTDAEVGPDLDHYPEGPDWVARLRSLLSLVGIPLGVGVAIYTGVLLGAIPARPFWNTPMVAQLFLITAFRTGVAALIVVAPFFAALTADQRRRQLQVLLKADLGLAFLQVFTIIPFIVHGELSVLSQRESLGMILGGPYTATFWLGVVLVGILLPFAFELHALAGHARRAMTARGQLLLHAAVVLILIGGYLLRWVFVHAGQDTSFV